jgi:hypothetical protein
VPAWIEYRTRGVGLFAVGTSLSRSQARMQSTRMPETWVRPKPGRHSYIGVRIEEGDEPYANVCVLLLVKRLLEMLHVGVDAQAAWYPNFLVDDGRIHLLMQIHGANSSTHVQ